jgi:hypothetical protein
MPKPTNKQVNAQRNPANGDSFDSVATECVAIDQACLAIDNYIKDVWHEEWAISTVPDALASAEQSTERVLSHTGKG